MKVNYNDLLVSAIFTVIGGFFLLNALWRLEIGSAFRMGPGYFPIVLGSVLIGFALVIALRAIGVNTPAEATRPPWRGIILLSSASILFGFTIRGLGFIPATALTVFIASFASRRMSLGLATLLTAGLTVFCVLVFSLGVGLPYPWIGPWLGNR